MNPDLSLKDIEKAETDFLFVYTYFTLFLIPSDQDTTDQVVRVMASRNSAAIQTASGKVTIAPFTCAFLNCFGQFKPFTNKPVSKLI